MVHIVGYRNKTRTSKVGAISKAQKAKVLKIVRALGFLKIQFVAKDLKNEGGPVRDIEKFSEKKTKNENFQSHSAEKCKSGDPL